MYCKDCKHFKKTQSRFGYCGAPVPVVIEGLMEREAVISDPAKKVECDVYEDGVELIEARNTPEYKEYVYKVFGPDT